MAGLLRAGAAGDIVTNDAAMRLMRASRLLASRGLCGRWLPGQAVLCACAAGHPLTCSAYQQMREAA